MVLKARWILSVALLALPIAITLGVLLGIDSHRRATGQPTFFRPETGPKRSKGVEYLTTCNKVTGFGKEYYKNGAFECKIILTLLSFHCPGWMTSVASLLHKTMHLCSDPILQLFHQLAECYISWANLLTNLTDNANPWGVKEGQDGDVCMTVSSEHMSFTHSVNEADI